MTLNRTAEPSLQSLERQLAGKPEPLRAVQRLQGLLETLLGYTEAIPFWSNPGVSLEMLAEQVDLYDWYRCGPVLLPRAPEVVLAFLGPALISASSTRGLIGRGRVAGGSGRNLPDRHFFQEPMPVPKSAAACGCLFWEPSS